LLYNLNIRPIYSVLLTVILAVMAYALFNWRQYVEHEEFMRRLNPFVTSLHLHERLLTSDADSERESRELFTALCRDALRTDHASLLFEATIGGLHERQRIDYRWPTDQEALLQSPLSDSSDWSRLDVDHWAYLLSDSRGAIGRLILGPKLDGNEYNILQFKETGRPVQPVYATEGSPMIVGPNGIFKGSPNPNAAKLFQSFCFSREAQQLIIDFGGLRSVHPQTLEKAGRTLLKDIKTMKDDPAAVVKMGDEIKAHYSKLFHV